MNYEILKPPFEIKDFSEMGKRDARKYFDWYISQIPIHMTSLEKRLIEDGVIGKLVYSEDLLVPIWAWYEKKISYRPLSEDEMAKKPLLMPNKVITEETIMYLQEIAMFLGEVFVNSFPDIEWGFYHGGRTVDSVNEPVLLGFRGGERMNPRRIVNVTTLRTSRENDASGLWEIYKIWKDKV